MAAFDVDNLVGIKEFYTRWGICEKKLGIQLTDVFDLVIIELNKAKKLLSQGKLKLNNNLEEWIKFFVKPYEMMEERNMEGLDEQLKKAYEELQKVNANEEERELAEHRYTELLRIKHMKEYEFNAGKEEGIKQGSKNKQIEIAKNLKNKRIDISIIAEVTGLTVSEIENI